MSSVIRSLVVKVGADISDFQAKTKNITKDLSKASKELTSIGKTMTMGITAPIVGIGAASFKMAADVQDAMGAADQIFGKSSKEMQSWAKGLSSHYGIASGEALEYSNTMGAMLQNIVG